MQENHVMSISDNKSHNSLFTLYIAHSSISFCMVNIGETVEVQVIPPQHAL